MNSNAMFRYLGSVFFLLVIAACNVPEQVSTTAKQQIPDRYNATADTINTGRLSWKTYFADPNLVALIDTALMRNQELQIVRQEIRIARNEARVRKGEYLPFVGVRAGAGTEKVGRYTSRGASEATTDIRPGVEMPEPLPDYMAGLYATWEVDIWHKLRNAKNAAVSRYLATVEGKNFIITNLVAEVAEAYYELLALDNQLNIVKQNISIQSSALAIVKLQKEATRVTELAVRKFEAEVLRTRSLQYDIQQRITETENHINLLLGHYPQSVPRTTHTFGELMPEVVHAGIPSQLLANRPDVKQAEHELAAAGLDVQVARARFYPSLGITAGIGYRAFNPSYLIKTPESLLYSIAGDLAAPLINRNAIKAAYNTAGAKQLQAVYHYDQTVLNAYIEVINQLSRISNLEKS